VIFLSKEIERARFEEEAMREAFLLSSPPSSLPLHVIK